MKTKKTLNTISGLVDRASAAETVDSDLIPRLVKPNDSKIGLFCFPALRLILKE